MFHKAAMSLKPALSLTTGEERHEHRHTRMNVQTEADAEPFIQNAKVGDLN